MMFLRYACAMEPFILHLLGRRFLRYSYSVIKSVAYIECMKIYNLTTTSLCPPWVMSRPLTIRLGNLTAANSRDATVELLHEAMAYICPAS
jgi:hypothetical protein